MVEFLAAAGQPKGPTVLINCRRGAILGPTASTSVVSVRILNRVLRECQVQGLFTSELDVTTGDEESYSEYRNSPKQGGGRFSQGHLCEGWGGVAKVRRAQGGAMSCAWTRDPASDSERWRLQ